MGVVLHLLNLNLWLAIPVGVVVYLIAIILTKTFDNQDKMIFAFQSYPYKRLRNIECPYLRSCKTTEYFCCFHNSVQKVFRARNAFQQKKDILCTHFLSFLLVI